MAETGLRPIYGSDITKSLPKNRQKGPPLPPEFREGLREVEEEEGIIEQTLTWPNAVRLGGSVAGDLLRYPTALVTGGVGAAATPFLFGAGSEGIARWMEDKPFDPAIMATEGALNLLPGAGAVPGKGAGLRAIAKYGAKAAGHGAWQGAAGAFPRHQAEKGTLLKPSEWEMPSKEEIAGQAAFGGVLGGAMGTAQAKLFPGKPPAVKPAVDPGIGPTAPPVQTPPAQPPSWRTTGPPATQQLDLGLEGDLRQPTLFPEGPTYPTHPEPTLPKQGLSGRFRSTRPMTEGNLPLEPPEGQGNLFGTGQHRGPLPMAPSAPVEPGLRPLEPADVAASVTHTNAPSTDVPPSEPTIERPLPTPQQGGKFGPVYTFQPGENIPVKAAELRAAGYIPDPTRASGEPLRFVPGPNAGSIQSPVPNPAPAPQRVDRPEIASAIPEGQERVLPGRDIEFTAAEVEAEPQIITNMAEGGYTPTVMGDRVIFRKRGGSESGSYDPFFGAGDWLESKIGRNEDVEGLRTHARIGQISPAEPEGWAEIEPQVRSEMEVPLDLNDPNNWVEEPETVLPPRQSAESQAAQRIGTGPDEWIPNPTPHTEPVQVRGTSEQQGLVNIVSDLIGNMRSGGDLDTHHALFSDARSRIERSNSNDAAKASELLEQRAAQSVQDGMYDESEALDELAQIARSRYTELTETPAERITRQRGRRLYPTEEATGREPLPSQYSPSDHVHDALLALEDGLPDRDASAYEQTLQRAEQEIANELDADRAYATVDYIQDRMMEIEEGGRNDEMSLLESFRDLALNRATSLRDPNVVSQTAYDRAAARSSQGQSVQDWVNEGYQSTPQRPYRQNLWDEYGRDRWEEPIENGWDKARRLEDEAQETDFFRQQQGKIPFEEGTVLRKPNAIEPDSSVPIDLEAEGQQPLNFKNRYGIGVDPEHIKKVVGELEPGEYNEGISHYYAQSQLAGIRDGNPGMEIKYDNPVPEGQNPARTNNDVRIIYRGEDGKPIAAATVQIYHHGRNTVSSLVADMSKGRAAGKAVMEVGSKLIELNALRPEGGYSSHTKNLLLKLVERASHEEGQPRMKGGLKERARRLGISVERAKQQQRSGLPRSSRFGNERGSVDMDLLLLGKGEEFEAAVSKLKHGTGSRWGQIVAQLDKMRAPDESYRTVMNSENPKPLKSGETWRQRVVNGIKYFESTVPIDSGEANDVNDLAGQLTEAFAQENLKPEGRSSLLKDETGMLGVDINKVKQEMGWGQGRSDTPRQKEEEVNYLKEVINFPTNATTTGDASGLGRQGLTMIFSPHFWTGIKPMLQSGWDVDHANVIFDKLMEKDIYVQPLDRATGKLGKSFAEQIGVPLEKTYSMGPGARAESIASRWLETGGFLGPKDIKGKTNPLRYAYTKTAGRVARGSNRMYVTILNHIRANTLEKLLNDARNMSIDALDTGKATPGFLPKKFNPAEALELNPYKNMTLAKEIADYVNTATGRGPLKTHVVPWRKAEVSLESAASKLSYVLFSPRLMASRMRMLNPNTYIMATPYVRKQYLKSMVSAGSAWLLMNQMAKLAGGDEVETSGDWTSADAGKIKIGNTRIDPGGGFQQFLVAYARFLTGGSTSSSTGEFHKFGEGYRADTPKDMFERMFSNKLNPVAKFAWDLASASEYKPFQVMDRTMQMFVPLLYQDLYEISQNDPTLVSGAFTAAAAGVGMGTQIYDAGEESGKFLDPENDWTIQGGGPIDMLPDEMGDTVGGLIRGDW